MNVRYAYSAPITWRMAPSWSIATAPKPGACNNQSAALRVPLTSNRHSSVTERIVPCPAKFNSNSSKPGRLPYKSSLSLSQRLRTNVFGTMSKYEYQQLSLSAEAVRLSIRQCRPLGGDPPQRTRLLATHSKTPPHIRAGEPVTGYRVKSSVIQACRVN
jgi:hypothetical protein